MILNSLYLHVVIDDKNVGDGVAVDVLAVGVAAFGQDQAVALLLANIDVTYRPWVMFLSHSGHMSVNEVKDYEKRSNGSI